jgi:hypothetical protein
MYTMDLVASTEAREAIGDRTLTIATSTEGGLVVEERRYVMETKTGNKK